MNYKQLNNLLALIQLSKNLWIIYIVLSNVSIEGEIAEIVFKAELWVYILLITPFIIFSICSFLGFATSITKTMVVKLLLANSLILFFQIMIIYLAYLELTTFSI